MNTKVVAISGALITQALTTGNKIPYQSDAEYIIVDSGLLAGAHLCGAEFRYSPDGKGGTMGTLYLKFWHLSFDEAASPDMSQDIVIKTVYRSAYHDVESFYAEDDSPDKVDL